MEPETSDSVPQPLTETTVNGVNGDSHEDVEMSEVNTEGNAPTNGLHEPTTTPAVPSTPQTTGFPSEPRAIAPALAPTSASATPAHTSTMPVKEASKDGSAPSPARASTPMFGLAIPEANPHGSATRVYLNTKVGPVLLEGMKFVAKHEPEKPLKWLAEFLAKRSKELEGE